jgi:hypothetical protein
MMFGSSLREAGRFACMPQRSAGLVFIEARLSEIVERVEREHR